jgi:DUF3024 family protein
VPIPPDTRAQAETALAEFCSQHSSAPGADPLRYIYQFEASAVLLIEQRPGFMSREDWQSLPRAKFRYSQARNEWSLYWYDTNGRWQRVSNVKADKDIRVLLKAVVTDSLGVFWS